MRSKNIVACVVALGTLFVASNAMAQESPKTRVGADLAFMMPLGNWADATGPMFGALLKLEYPAIPNLGITARTGFIYGLNKSTSSPFGDVKYGISDVPLWAGARYYFLEPGNGLWGGLELGLNYLMARAEIMGVSGRSSEAKFGMGVGAGYRIDDIDIGVKMNFVDLGHAGDSMAVLATVGYDFAKF